MKTACTVQCEQCPFRRTSLPGYLGSYDLGYLFSSLWKGFPFFCHTKINYSSPSWKKRTEKDGKICLGSIVFAKKIYAPMREVEDDELRQARLSNENRSDVECMDAKEFMKWHDPKNASKNFKLLKKRTANEKEN